MKAAEWIAETGVKSVITSLILGASFGYWVGFDTGNAEIEYLLFGLFGVSLVCGLIAIYCGMRPVNQNRLGVLFLTSLTVGSLTARYGSVLAGVISWPVQGQLGPELRAKIPGLKNDAWFKRNKDKVKFELTKWDSRNDEKRVSGVALLLHCRIENSSDEKLIGVIIEVAIINEETKKEALREKIWLELPVFRTEKRDAVVVELASSWGITETTKDESEIWECFKRIKEKSYTYSVVTVIPESMSDSEYSIALYYYKAKSTWGIDTGGTKQP